MRRDRISVVHVGADTRSSRRIPPWREVPGRIVTTSSADVLKGLVFLVEGARRGAGPSTRTRTLVVVGTRRRTAWSAAAIER
ncbi:hypothetical protein [Streptomyces sp. KL116D]|uniref:hypothetical protein n=1 Tax=Streptomyces sp. KL116D TaxID=3045152 RepID=UPI003558F2B7